LTQRLEDLEMDRERHNFRRQPGGGGSMPGPGGSGRGTRGPGGPGMAPGSMASNIPPRVQYPNMAPSSMIAIAPKSSPGVFSPPVVSGYPRQQNPTAKRDY